MISAFGVDHGGVSKAMIGPGVFRAISALPKTAARGQPSLQGLRREIGGRKASRIGNTAALKRGERVEPSARVGGGENRRGNPLQPGSRMLNPGGPSWSHQKKTTWHQQGQDTPQAAKFGAASAYQRRGGEARPAGGSALSTSNKGGGQINMYAKPGQNVRGTSAENIHAHEQRHLAPHRNPVSYRQRMKDPYRKGREEGRADFGLRNDAAGQGGGTHYPGGAAFRAGYMGVQNRMARSQGKAAPWNPAAALNKPLKLPAARKKSSRATTDQDFI